MSLVTWTRVLRVNLLNDEGKKIYCLDKKGKILNKVAIQEIAVFVLKMIEESAIGQALVS